MSTPLRSRTERSVQGGILRRWLTRRHRTATTASAQDPWPGVSAGADVLFLDMHGVIHPWATETYECLPYLYQVLDAVPSLQVVVATSWYHYVPRRHLLARVDAQYRDRFRDALALDVHSPVAREVLLMRYVRDHKVHRFAAVTGYFRRFTARCGWAFQLPASEGLNDMRARALANFVTARVGRGLRRQAGIVATQPW